MGLGHRQRPDALPDKGINLWYRRNAVEQGADIEPRSADQQRDAPVCPHLGDCFAGVLCPLRSGIALGSVDMTKKPVWRLSLVRRGWPCCYNPQVTIDLARIGIDDRDRKQS